MTAKELIEELQKLPQDSDIYVASERELAAYSSNFWIRQDSNFVFLEVLDD